MRGGSAVRVTVEEGEDLGVVDPGNIPRGRGENMCRCTRALGQAFPCHRSAASASGRRQHDSSGQCDTPRFVVSRPRNQRASSNGTPTVIEKSPSRVVPVWVEHQKVPAGVSVYW